MKNLWCHLERSNIVAKSKDLVQLFLSLFLCAVLFVACGDDDSSFAPRDSENSSSTSMCEDCDDGSSSSDKSSSSSSKSSGLKNKRVQCNVKTDDNCIKDDRDGQTYKTVKIGDQVWMAENLNYAYTDVPYDCWRNTSDSTSWCYDNDLDNCAKYGRLYTWAAAMDSAATWSTTGKGCGYNKTCSATYPVRGICPEGWHLPNTDEFYTLFEAVGGKSRAALKLKSTSGWTGFGAPNGTDDFSFSALPAGYWNEHYSSEGSGAHFWTSNESVRIESADHIYLTDDVEAWNDLGKKYNGYSVRCLQDGAEYKRVQCDVKTDENCIKDSRDGQTYKTVKIGDQTWMAENLNYETANSFCYEKYASNCSKYGRFYLWSAAMDSAGTWSTTGKGCGYNKTCLPTYPVRGVCPEGWHLPDSTEWNTLFEAVGGQSVAGTKLKSTSGWTSSGNGTDDFSFSALPTGFRYFSKNYGLESYTADFWSSNEDDSLYVSTIDLGYRDSEANLYHMGKEYAFSVRCIKD